MARRKVAEQVALKEQILRDRALIATKASADSFAVCDKVFGYAMLGANNRELASLLGVSEATIEDWHAKVPAFAEALHRGRAHADANVVAALYRNATGYEYPAERVFCNSEGVITRAAVLEYHKPDTQAQMFWLKNRERDRWREATFGDSGIGIAVNINLG